MKQSQKYALISVYDKRGIVEFASKLVSLGYLIISTGGTAKVLLEHNIPVVPIEKITRSPESFDGRMKTISFQIESGILFDRDIKKHRIEAKQLNVPSIDIVVCNFYPFEKVVSDKKSTHCQIVENIDIGGPTMVRAAAKNYKHVLVVTDPADYQKALIVLIKNSVALRKKFSAKAYRKTALYDSIVANYLTNGKYPDEITIPGRKLIDLRYGENPHQTGAVYLNPTDISPFKNLTKVRGRDLSLTNAVDIASGIQSVRMFKEPCAVVIKHNSPCGIALGSSPFQALARAIEADPESAFGGVVVLNKRVDKKAAEAVGSFKSEHKSNIDILAAPIITKEAIEMLGKIRKTTGLYTFGSIPAEKSTNLNIKWIDGGFILQTPDIVRPSFTKNWKVVTKRRPTRKQWEQMEIAWKMLTRVKSNSVIVVDRTIPMTRGIGNGQTSRVRSTKLALSQAGAHAKGAILASDSFFPFDDSVRLAGKKGISAVVQQGGSVRDKYVIEACDKLGLAMVFTGRRAFWH